MNKPQSQAEAAKPKEHPPDGSPAANASLPKVSPAAAEIKDEAVAKEEKDKKPPAPPRRQRRMSRHEKQLDGKQERLRLVSCAT